METEEEQAAPPAKAPEPVVDADGFTLIQKGRRTRGHG